MINLNANALARALQKNRAQSKPNYTQNPSQRLGTVVDTYDPANSAGFAPIIFDGEDTAITVITGIPVFARDRVLLQRIGNTWGITANFTTARETYTKRKPANTARTGNNAATPDNDMQVTLTQGTWIVDMTLIYDAGTTGKFSTTWIVPADGTGTVNCVGPGANATTDIRGNGSTARMASHQYTTPVIYAGGGTGLYNVAREWALIDTVTGGTVTLGWARPNSDTPATNLRELSYVQLTRVK